MAGLALRWAAFRPTYCLRLYTLRRAAASHLAPPQPPAQSSPAPALVPALPAGGDGAILAAALFYSLGVVRITGYAQSLSPSEIATSKSFVLGGLALASLVAATGSAAAQGLPAQSLWGGVGSDPLMWAALLWSGLGPGALASYLHARASTAAAVGCCC